LYGTGEVAVNPNCRMLRRALFDLESQPLGQNQKVGLPSQNKYQDREAYRADQEAEGHFLHFRVHLASCH
jgi:hypothetical protein